MSKVCGVKFGIVEKIHYYNAKDLETKQGDFVVVETDRGTELGRVVIESASENKKATKDIMRLATYQDMEQFHNFKMQAISAFAKTQNKIKEYKLPMKLLYAEHLLDGLKIIFYFTAKGRIDFRELVKDLAGIFKKRIEMYQIGVRDESKICGSLGVCGRVACCKSYLHEFSAVSINMAKDQNLSLNPVKLSGVCGRLFCCLSYENDFYTETKSLMPKLNSQVMYEGNIATVVDYNICKKTVIIEFPETRAKSEVKFDLLKPA